MQRRPDAVELAAVAEDASHFVPVVTQSEIAVAVGISYVVAVSVDADVAIAVVDAVIAVSACADAGYAFDDASAIQQEADCPVHRVRFDDQQRLLEVCNWHIR